MSLCDPAVDLRGLCDIDSCDRPSREQEEPWSALQHSIHNGSPSRTRPEPVRDIKVDRPTRGRHMCELSVRACVPARLRAWTPACQSVDPAISHEFAR